MHLESYQTEIERLCRVYGVRRLWAFGSVLTDAFRLGESDVDLLVEYADNRTLGPWLCEHFALKAALEEVLSTPVDLVIAGKSHPSRFEALIERDRRALFAA